MAVDSSIQDMLDDRYGRTSPATARRRMIIWIAIVGVTALVWSFWYATTTGDPAVSTQDVGFDIVDAAHTTVTFDVTMAPGSSAVCTVRALNASSAEVGLTDVSIAADTVRTQRVRATVPTSETAVTGLVKSCLIASSDD